MTQTRAEAEREHDEWNALPAHQGFVSEDERDFVRENVGRPLPDASPWEVWNMVVAYRGGTSIPVPSYKYLRANWDFSRIDGVKHFIANPIAHEMLANRAHADVQERMRDRAKARGEN